MFPGGRGRRRAPVHLSIMQEVRCEAPDMALSRLASFRGRCSGHAPKPRRCYLLSSSLHPIRAQLARHDCHNINPLGLTLQQSCIPNGV